ncbi:hypothetical protein JHW45_00330 [Paracoccus stylophorae]|uniref:Subtilase family protein n=1 Tax=Paracoccus stylophorae TaxID=659350 RepID=A0ABY7SV49_9RHOB|nr:hypothetical protein [Paracoccus stylophorae]WCR10910.1 hypothetical protein JHW45_00330 [Paracoccus stylophorae]
MIAHATISAFEAFLNDPSGILPDDAINPDPQPMGDQDLSDPALAYLADEALPDPESGCIIGIVDDAIPFAHERLRLANGRTRIASIWVQDARFRPESGAGIDLSSGIELRGAEIDALLADAAAGHLPGEDAIYRRSGVIDMTRESVQSAAFAAGHGAAVAGLAAGFAPGDPAARNHPVLAVNLPPKVTEDSMGQLSPISILSSFLFIIIRAHRLCRFIEVRRNLPQGSVRLPVVINLSFGLTAGARDGSSQIESFMDAVSRQGAPGLGPIHFVLPTGNHRLARLSGRLKPGEDLGWRLPPDDRTVTPLEVWGPPLDALPDDRLQISLTPPGMAAATTEFTSNGDLSFLTGAGDRELARAYYQPRQRPDGTWRESVTVMIRPTCPERLDEPCAPSGEWRIGIGGSSHPAEYEICVQRDEVIRGFHREARQSWLYDPDYRVHDESGRIIRTDAQNGGHPKVLRTGAFNAYAGGDCTLRSGAAVQQDMQLAAYSSLLPDDQGGDTLAPVDRSVTHPGMIVCARGSGSFDLLSGTSMSAPQMTRWLAAQLAAGQGLPDRAAIRALAESLSHIGGPTPVLDDLNHFPPY